MKKFYWVSEMRRINYGSDSQVRQRCLIYEHGNPELLASCAEVSVAEKVVEALNNAEEKAA